MENHGPKSHRKIHINEFVSPVNSYIKLFLVFWMNYFIKHISSKESHRSKFILKYDTEGSTEMKTQSMINQWFPGQSTRRVSLPDSWISRNYRPFTHAYNRLLVEDHSIFDPPTRHGIFRLISIQFKSFWTFQFWHRTHPQYLILEFLNVIVLPTHRNPSFLFL